MSTPAQIEAVAKALWEEASHREWGYWENQGGKWQEAWRKSAQAALAAAEAAAWQPIETAPKNRISVLVMTPDGMCIAFWDQHEHSWLTAEEHSHCRPTKWRPLPPPPNA